MKDANSVSTATVGHASPVHFDAIKYERVKEDFASFLAAANAGHRPEFTDAQFRQLLHLLRLKDPN
eukprot:2417855-Karenia_brevis.AAC.1